MDNETLVSNSSIAANQFNYPVKFHVAAYSICSLFSIFFNLINLIVIPQATQCFSDNTRLCFMFLSVIDLFTGIICSGTGVIFVFVQEPLWFRYAVNFVCTLFVTQSLLILFLASIDRYVAITVPLRYTTFFSSTKMAVALATSVALNLANSLGNLIQSQITGECHPFSRMCSAKVKPSYAVYHVLPFSAALISISINIRMILIAHRHARQIAAQREAVLAGRNHQVEPQRHIGLRGLKSVLVVCVSFYAVWLPANITSFVGPVFGASGSAYFLLVLRYAILCNSWWNPVVYLILNQTFRTIVMKNMRRVLSLTNNRVEMST